MLGVDQLATLCRIGLGEQDLFRILAELGVAVVAVAVGKGKFGGLDYRVQILLASCLSWLQVIALQQVQHFMQHGPASSNRFS